MTSNGGQEVNGLNPGGRNILVKVYWSMREVHLIARGTWKETLCHRETWIAACSVRRVSEAVPDGYHWCPACLVASESAFLAMPD